MNKQHSFDECIVIGLGEGLVHGRSANVLSAQNVLDESGLLPSDHICDAIARALLAAGYKQL